MQARLWQSCVQLTGILAVTVLLLTACTASSGPRPASGGATRPAAAPAAADAKTLSLLYWQAPTILNPHQATGLKDYAAANVILEPLAHFDGKDQLIPYLASTIPTHANGGVARDDLSVTWKLKEGVKWSDGSDFTADDVVFTWEYCADPQTACTSAASFRQVQKVEAINRHTVKITWKAPTPYPYEPFVGYYGFILQQKQFGHCIGANAVKDAACQQANLAPIGTNAYQLESFKPGDTGIYVRNPYYRNADQVAFDKVIIKGGGDATSAAMAVCKTGEFDYAWNLQVQKAVLEPILASGRCDSVIGGSSGVERIVFNFANPDPALGEKRAEPDQPHPILSDRRVRQAIAKAIDRQSIVDHLYGPSGRVTCNAVVAPANLDSPNTRCARDVEGAKALLAAAGWQDTNGNGSVDKDGKELTLLLQTAINPLRQGEQTIIKQNLADIGIHVDLKAVDPGVFFGGDIGNPDTLNKFYADMQIYSYPPSSPDPAAQFMGWTCATVNAKANQWNAGNSGRYCNPEFDRLFQQMEQEADPARRAELAVQLNDFLIEDTAIVPLVNRFAPAGKAKGLVGPTPNTFDDSLWNIEQWRGQP